MALYILGVDWADQSHEICVIDEQGKRIAQRVLSNFIEGNGDFSFCHDQPPLG